MHGPLSSHKASGIYWHLPHGTQVQWWGGTSIRALSEYGGPVAQISILVTRKTQILSLKAEFVDKIQVPLKQGLGRGMVKDPPTLNLFMVEGRIYLI